MCASKFCTRTQTPGKSTFFLLASLLILSFSDFNHQPFARHQVEGTLRAYERLVVQLLLFLLRAGQDMDLPPDVKAALQALRRGLQGDMDDAGQAIHSLLLALWMREWTPTVDNLFPDPTVCFVIHTQVNQDGSLKKPESVTGIFAKLVYDMVSDSVLLHSIYADSL